ncbi:MAG: threonine/serine dehydratase [Pseudomonadota bacterium]
MATVPPIAMADMSPPTFDDVKAAAERVKPLAVRTPILRNDALDEAVGAEVFIKAECLQTTGSFKIRGATNRLSQITDPDEKRAGVVAFSSGNHAQGVARAAKYFGLPALIVMPADAPRVKVDGVLTDGAEIRPYDRVTEAREEIAADIARSRGAIIVPSYDDPDIIAGQGTAGLEIIEDMADRGWPLDHYISCAGGGGLVGGAALAFSALSPQTKVWTAEPEGYDDHRLSLKAREIRAIDPSKMTSICDAILTPQPGNITFAVNGSRLAGGLATSDDRVKEAMRFAFRHLKLVVEPGGAIALACAMFALPEEAKGKRVGVVLSGGNVDAAMFAEILREA